MRIPNGRSLTSSQADQATTNQQDVIAAVLCRRENCKSTLNAMSCRHGQCVKSCRVWIACDLQDVDRRSTHPAGCGSPQHAHHHTLWQFPQDVDHRGWPRSFPEPCRLVKSSGCMPGEKGLLRAGAQAVWQGTSGAKQYVLQWTAGCASPLCVGKRLLRSRVSTATAEPAFDCTSDLRTSSAL